MKEVVPLRPAPKRFRSPGQTVRNRRRRVIVRPAAEMTIAVEAAPTTNSVTELTCHYCGDPAASRDHVVPKSRGGRNDPLNIVPACLPCNQLKADLSLEEFYLEFRRRIGREWFVIYAKLSEGPSSCSVCGWAVRYRRKDAPRSDWHLGLETISIKVPRCQECGFEMVNEQRFFTNRRRIF